MQSILHMKTEIYKIINETRQTKPKKEFKQTDRQIVDKKQRKT